ncbi:Mitochondrial inner membrane protease subunit 1 [Penicillium ucsense]|uniref:Mitochondrial inner membrane protease subunit 1 n=1 Tax=Penicillium ucsense TaxID=2839758 RepID=A0A8J8W5P1_9EURO|nr:Mitochondrial inner membrane protease subunit 1 [Penicillium ucsense]KAF7737547.1 Mitochondrial inner membrane protease subunit 1 [Penicillium ucsense]
MERLLRSVLQRPRAAAITVFNGVGLFCACAWTWENVVTIQKSEGPSMYPTFNTRGDWLMISRRHAYGKDIQVGDIVRYHHPLILGAQVAKRVVGMPGDFVCLDPPYSFGAGTRPDMIRVPEGHVFVAGDNLPWSRDSRTYGSVPMGLINGKVVARVWPPSQMEWMRNPLQPVDQDIS